MLLFPLGVSAAPFDVTAYGAVGDGVTDDTKAVAKALLAAGKHHPSVVLFPGDKTFLTGPINMTSDMTIQVDGTLKAKSGNNTADGIAGWPQIPPLPSYGNSRDGAYLQFQAFVYAHTASNIAINGSGTIDGQGDWWWRNQRNRSAVPSGRPNLIQFVEVNGIEVTGVTLRDSPFWCLHPVQSQDIHVHHMKIRSRMYAPNSDGVDPDSSKNVMIEYNDISTGDDGIAIKAGACGTGFGSGPGSSSSLQGGPTPISCANDTKFSDGTYLTQNVTVRYNTFRIGMGISVGSESSGGVKDIYIHDNVVGVCEAGSCLDTCCGWGPGIHIKTTLTRGQFLSNIIVENNTIYNNTGFIDLETNYQSGEDLPVHYPKTVVKDISFIGNRALGHGVGATFACDVNDVCHNITVSGNTIANSENSWNCKYIETWTAAGNTGETNLEKCMHNSMHPSSGAKDVRLSFEQRKQAAIRAWDQRGDKTIIHHSN